MPRPTLQVLHCVYTGMQGCGQQAQWCVARRYEGRLHLFRRSWLLVAGATPEKQKFEEAGSRSNSIQPGSARKSNLQHLTCQMYLGKFGMREFGKITTTPMAPASAATLDVSLVPKPRAPPSHTCKHAQIRWYCSKQRSAAQRRRRHDASS